MSSITSMFSSSTFIGIAVLLLVGSGWYVYSMWRKIKDVKDETEGKIQCVFHMKDKTAEVCLLTAEADGITPPAHHISMAGEKYQVMEEAVQMWRYPLYEPRTWAQVKIPTLEFHEGESIPLTIETGVKNEKGELVDGGKFVAHLPAGLAEFITNKKAAVALTEVVNRIYSGNNQKEKMTLVYILCGLALLAALVAAYFGYTNGHSISEMKSMWGY